MAASEVGQFDDISATQSPDHHDGQKRSSQTVNINMEQLTTTDLDIPVAKPDPESHLKKCDSTPAKTNLDSSTAGDVAMQTVSDESDLPAARSNFLLEGDGLPLDILNWLRNHNKATIVITGKSGVGKSTLINLFLGIKKADVAIGLRPETKIVKEYECTRVMNGVTLYLYDSPGFEPNSHWSSLKKIKKCFRTENPDLVFFCVRMDERPQKEDYDAMTSLSNAFGPEVWTNTVIVLTRGNQLPKERFRECSKDLSAYLMEHLTKGGKYLFQNGPGVKKTDAEKIPMVPVGNEEVKTLESAARPWIHDLLLESLTRCSAAGAPALLKANWLMYKLHLKHSVIGHLLTKMKIKPYNRGAAVGGYPIPDPSSSTPLLTSHTQRNASINRDEAERDSAASSD